MCDGGRRYTSVDPIMRVGESNAAAAGCDYRQELQAQHVSACAHQVMGPSRMTTPDDVPGPTLVTDRLILRPFRRTDLDALAALAADPRVMRHIGSGPETRGDVEQGIERAIRRWYEQGMSWWAVLDRHDENLIGRCCLQHMRDLPEVEVGYAFARHVWGLGLASEAVHAALDHGFREHRLKSVVALTHPDNVRSWRLLERCGFALDREVPLRAKRLSLYRISLETWSKGSRARPSACGIPPISTELTARNAWPSG